MELTLLHLTLSFPTPTPQYKHKPPTLHHRNFHLHSHSRLHSLSSSHSHTLETLDLLEWPSICNQLTPFTSTTMAHTTTTTSSIPIGNSLSESLTLLSQTSAALALPHPLDFSGIVDVSSLLRLVSSGREALNIPQICSVGRTLRSARRLFEQVLEFDRNDDKFSERSYALIDILKNCNFLVELEQKIEFCLDCSLSVVRDTASDDLGFIRSERKKNMDELESVVKSISQRVFQAGGIDRPLVTNRRARMCVGVKASHRSLLPDGVVLDVSGSGATYFMEPKEVVDLNNMEVWLANSEKEEERAILTWLTSEIGTSAADINDLLSRINEVDLAVARAGHAKWLNGVCPSLKSALEGDDNLLVDIEGVRHPLLLESYIKNVGGPYSKEIDKGTGVISIGEIPDEAPKLPVPIDIKIRRGTSVVIISGPNAGGKTASMKTLGLASIMSKAGLYLPAKKPPVLPWFDLVLADIGDRQSLEKSLSTFSGHILRIGKFLEVASKDSLVLIDEIGSGTDPSEGAVLAASMLQYFKERVKLAVVTTHYADLSRLKEMDDRFENAAMEFCLDTLRPTYQVLWGCAGESNALRIARRVGFNSKIIDRAESWLERLMPEKQAQRKGLLYQCLSEERDKMEEKARRAASFYSDVMELYHEIEGETLDLDSREMALIAKETQQIEQDLEFAKTQINSVVQEFENQLRSTDVTDAKQYVLLFQKAESSIASIVTSHQPKGYVSQQIIDLYTPQPGEKVKVKNLRGKLATVIDVTGDNGTVLVQYGKMRLRVDQSDILQVKEATLPATFSSRKAGSHISKP